MRSLSRVLTRLPKGDTPARATSSIPPRPCWLASGASGSAPVRLAPLNRSFLIFSTAGIRPRPGSGALREVVRKEERREAELALVHDAYRQDHAPRAE